METHDKTALITGGARIGRTVAEALVGRGLNLALGYRTSREPAEEAAAFARRAGVTAETFQADLTDPDHVARLIGSIDERWGRLDVIVHLASLYRKKNFDDLTAEDWDENMNADARSGWLLAREAAPLLRRHGGGRIVFVSDWTAAGGRPRYKGYLPYYAAKASVKALTEALALELAPDVLVNAVAPGPILPPEDLSESEIRAVEDATPLGRWGGAGEIAKAVLFLVDADFVTGECIRVDGGRHLK